MKNILKFWSIITILIISSCSTTNQVIETGKEATSFENALIVTNIDEEYKYVNKVCPKCKFLGQSLTFQNDKPYDILRYKKPDGTNVSYYFDISKFFGKY